MKLLKVSFKTYISVSDQNESHAGNSRK